MTKEPMYWCFVLAFLAALGCVLFCALEKLSSDDDGPNDASSRSP